MKVAAIIAEYNPFHLGHAWQLSEAKRIMGDDVVFVAIMSGCMTQRGEPAILDKWSRTQMAMACGVSLVIELPFAYASASAERFARGGVQLAESTGLASHLIFGSECGDLERLNQLAGLLVDEPADYRALLHSHLDHGESFAAARQKAVAAATGDIALSETLSHSNNILAVEYLKAIKTIDSHNLTPFTLLRQGQAYNANAMPSPSDGFASASAIRRRVRVYQSRGSADMASLVSDLAAAMPPPALAVLMEKIQAGPGPLALEDLATPIIGMLRSLSPGFLDEIPGMSEGLGRRLATAAGRPKGLSTTEDGRLAVLLSDAATRRFPQTRIQRALLAMLAGLSKEDLNLFDQNGGPQYLRILGFDKKGRHLLKIMRKQARLPVLMNMSDRLEHKNEALVRMAELDSIAVDLWMLSAGKRCGLDFDTPAVMR